MSNEDPLKSRRLPRFVEEYVKDPNGTRAALAAGFPASWAHVAASRMLKEPKVQALIAKQREKVSKAATLEAADVLREWFDVATADPSKLMHVRRVNCRHCWGVNHAYQWKAREYAEACDRAASHKDPKTGAPAPMPLCDGGFGFNRVAEPNPSCPECEGEGLDDVVIADIASLSGPERKLFAGVKLTKNGPEIVMRDQDKARDNIAKYLGMMIEKREVTGKDGRPLIPTAPPADLPTDPAKLGALYSQIVGG